MRPEKINSFMKDSGGTIARFFKAFRDFALRGNVIDMAIGIIIGSSFNEIVSSLVQDIIMPPVGLLMAGTRFSDYAITIRDAVRNDAGEIVKEKVTLNIGAFLQHLIDFIIVALSLFIVIQLLSKVRNKVHKQEAAAEKKQQKTQENLLREIRDELRRQSPRDNTE